jgi:lipoate-protein ligase A
MEIFRLLSQNPLNPHLNLAIEEAILRGVLEKRSPYTFRLWQHTPVVTIGCFQDPREELNMDLCDKFGVLVARRMCGGGAMYLDQGSLIYSIFLDDNFPNVPNSLQESYRFFSEGVIEGLKDLGVEAHFRPVNDIVVNNKKISGASSIHLYSAFVHHGAVNINPNLEILEKVLKASEIKLKEKGFSSIKESLTSLEIELGKKVRIDIVKVALIRGFEKKLKVQFKRGKLTDWEANMAKMLYKNKYKTSEWIFGRTKPSLELFSTYRAAKGVIKVSLSVKGIVISDIYISGDFLLQPNGSLRLLEESLRGCIASEEYISETISNFFKMKQIKALGVTAEDFVKAVFQALQNFSGKV